MKWTIMTVLLSCAFLLGFAQAQQPKPTEPATEAVGCPDPVQYCRSVNQGEATKYCANEDCFDMNETEVIRLVAVDDAGDFPRKWNLWHQETLSKDLGTYPCVLDEKELKKNTKTKLSLPENSNICVTVLKSNGHVYREHFVANPATKCLGWVECKL